MKLIVASLLIITIKLIGSTQANLDVSCPGGYQLIPNTQACVLITQNATVHSNLCLSTGSTSTVYYLELILNRNVNTIIDFLHSNKVDKFWLPIAKDEQNFLVWKLPMPLWNRNVDEVSNMTAPKTYADGKCAMYIVDKQNWFMNDCHHEYQHVCFYDKNESAVVMHTGFCANKLMGRSPKLHGICFEVEKIKGNTTMRKSTVIMDSYEKLAFTEDFINLVGMAATKILSYSVNNKDVLVIQNGVFVHANIDDVHYRLVEDKVASVVFNQKSSIELSYQPKSDTIAVTIRNFDYLWNPHNNDVPLTCHYDINILNRTIPLSFNRTDIAHSQKKIILNLPHYKGVGNLWCEAQQLFTFETITSNRLVLNRNIQPTTKVLSVSIESNYCKSCSNIYSDLYEVRDFTNHFTNEIRDFDEFDIMDVQLKKIIVMGANRIKYLFHIVLETKEPEQLAQYFESHLHQANLTGYAVTAVRLNDECSSSYPDYFPSVKINEKSVIKMICFLDTGLPPTQECVGNLIDGAEWRQEYDINALLTNNCHRRLENGTKELFKLNEMLRKLSHDHDAASSNKETRAMVEETLTLVNKTVTMEHNQITDIRYATETLHNLLETVPADLFADVSHENVTKSSAFLEPFCEIIDTILNQETNSLITNNNGKILETIDLMAEKIANNTIPKLALPGSNTTDTADIQNHHNDDNDDGVTLIQQKNFIVMIVNPLIKNITGIALYKYDANVDETSFHDFTVRKLRSDDTWQSVYNESLEITAHIPTESFDQIKIMRDGELVPPNCIIFKIYYKNSFFNENITAIQANASKTETIESESKVIGITIPHYYGNELPPGIFTMFKTKRKLTDTKLDDGQLGCSDNSRTAESRSWNRKLWNYDSMSGSIVMCPVKRLANIGFVKLFGNKIVTDETSILLINVLHYTTIVGCSLSLVGIILIFITTLVYDEWKTREATPLVLHVSTATFLQLAMFVVAESGVFKQTRDCLIIGGILHYVTLAGFFISLFVTNCQYRRYIIVFGSAKTKYFKTKIFIFGWIAPLLIVAGCLISMPDSYILSMELHELGGICYPNGLILYLFVHGPIILIFCINVFVYIWIVIQMTRENPNLRKIPKKSKVVMQIRLFFFIFFMLSLTWAFGLLAHYLESMIFAYLFNVTGPMQGFCLFIFCVVIDDKTRLFWVKFIFRTKK